MTPLTDEDRELYYQALRITKSEDKILTDQELYCRVLGIDINEEKEKEENEKKTRKELKNTNAKNLKLLQEKLGGFEKRELMRGPDTKLMTNGQKIQWVLDFNKKAIYDNDFDDPSDTDNPFQWDKITYDPETETFELIEMFNEWVEIKPTKRKSMIKLGCVFKLTFYEGSSITNTYYLLDVNCRCAGTCNRCRTLQNY